MLKTRKISIGIVLCVVIALAGVSTAAFYGAAQTATPTPAPTQTGTAPAALNATAIGQALGTPVVITNNQSGVVTAVLARQAPQVKVNGTVVNNFTLANSVIDFWTVPNMPTNTVYVRGFFGLTENETNPVLYKAISYNWTILNLHPYMVGDTPKLQFLHWQTMGNLSTVLSQINNVTALTTIGKMNTTIPPMQKALNPAYIGAELNGTVVNGPVVDVMMPRMDVNVTANVNGTQVTLNTFASMVTSFEFAPANMTGSNATAATMVNASSGQVMVMGDFALLDSEVWAVEKTLMCNPWNGNQANFTITAVHDHMLNETPKMTFVHFAATGDLNNILTVIDTAINQTNIRGNMTTLMK